MARRAVLFIALLLATCICLVAVAWKSYDDVANKIALPPEKPALTAQPAPPAVQAEVANGASPQSAPLAQEAGRSNEPFGFSTARLTTGTLLEKWLNIEREINAERLVLRICDRNRASCQSRAALQFLAIVDSGRSLGGRARLGHINRAINLKIKQMSDLTIYGEEDVWSSPLATLAIGAGDCEDFAIAKFVALQEAGVSPDDLRIVIVQDIIRKENHAVVAARLNGNWQMLDNRHMVMVEDRHVLNYHPVFLIDHDGVRLYLDAPSTAKGLGGYSGAALIHR
jgi:predicted transglutaminase-like cysteine proteinase